MASPEVAAAGKHAPFVIPYKLLSSNHARAFCHSVHVPLATSCTTITSSTSTHLDCVALTFVMLLRRTFLSCMLVLDALDNVDLLLASRTSSGARLEGLGAACV
eukprot:1162116-Pelagomonas_calceolata.AAC.9